MADNTEWTWRRGFNRYAPLAAIIIGLVLILSSLPIAAMAGGVYARVVSGIALVIAGYVYRLRPILTSERKYAALRGEVDNFIDLVRKLNRTAIAIGGGPEFDEVSVAMRESMRRIEELAGKES